MSQTLPMTAASAGACPEQAVASTPSLSAREVEVLLAWILSDTKAEVCRRLYISPGTVNTHLARIREKYSRAGRPATTKAALLARALQDGHIGLDEI
ncbi:helix-turn-helix transcriptional regulator [Nocardia sp. NPDC052254]|uniref:helix-turn-helix transcriptional regulator n=1 Tax=Nocardia sp. NPDC052254 TaxID=3155681 RepID=UPI00341C5870